MPLQEPALDLSEIHETFVTESNDLLAEMEQALLRLEASPNDQELINQVFRAAHTIKGSAGIFGWTDLVFFTHSVESVLNFVREEKLRLDGKLVALMLQCRDHMQRLVEIVGAPLPSELKEIGDDLLSQLAKLNGSSSSGEKEYQTKGPCPEVNSPAQQGSELHLPGPVWFLSVRFSKDCLRDGLDPASTLAYLATLGEAKRIVLVSDALPVAEDMDPECCYLGIEMAFLPHEGVTRADVDGAFDFVRDDSVIHIFQPGMSMSYAVAAINDAPRPDNKVGSMLVDAGLIASKDLKEPSPSTDIVTVRASSSVTMTAAGEDNQPPRHEEASPAFRTTPETSPTPKSRTRDAIARSPSLPATEAPFIRVDAAKLESLIALVGELVIAGSSTELYARRSADEQLLESTQTMLRLVEEVRDNALNMRMVPIGLTFNRFQRVVRDISKTLGKEVDLVITGADAELDKSVVERIADPLMHLIRNSLDHGIEKPSERVASGKPRKATLHLNAYHSSGSIILEVTDDGAGLDTEKIFRRAIESGLVAAGAQLSDREIHDLVFEPGFSTADEITALSGRGVGMDVVRENIESLRGTIEILSVRQVGTTMKIRLPLTLAIIDGFLVGVASTSYVIPLDMVVECVDFSAALKASQLEESSDRCAYVSLRGEVLPYIRLSEHFNHGGFSPGRRENIVIVQYGNRKAGLVVDSLKGETQTVIKPLGRIFQGPRGIGGSTILGSGEVALVLDVQDLLAKAMEDASLKIRMH